MNVIVPVVRLLDANKARFAFLAPVVTAAGAAAASWVVTGSFDASEIRTAASGAVLGAVSGIATWLAPARGAVVSTDAVDAAKALDGAPVTEDTASR